MKIRFETFLVIICCVLFLVGLVKANPIQDLKNSSQAKHQIAKKQNAKIFDGEWNFEEIKYGRLLSLYVKIKQVGNKLTGEYGNVSSKESQGNILSSKITGKTAIIKIDCDWGGNGTVRITRLKGNKLHWKVIKRDESKGEFIVLVDQILVK